MRVFHTDETCPNPYCKGTLNHVYECECKQLDDDIRICLNSGKCHWWQCALCLERVPEPQTKYTREPRTDNGTERERLALQALLSKCDTQTFSSRFKATTNYVSNRGDPDLLEHPLPST